MITIGTDFSGIGSPEQALIKLGIKHKSMFACDIDKYAKQSYLANYNPERFYNDITKRNHNEAPYVDLYVAGFPCQTFSMAGKRKGFEDTRGTLFFDLLKYLKAKKPKYFVLENVKGLLSHNGGRTFLTILDCLAKTVNRQYSFTNYEDGLNYYVYYKVLNTKDYGIPQNRERVFIVGFRDEKHSFKFPKKIPLELKLKDVLQENVDNKYYLSDKMIKGIEKSNFKERQPVNLNGVCRTLKIGGDTPCLKVHSLYPRSSKTGKGGTGHLSKEDGTTYCLDTGNNQAIEYDKRIRRLTPKECFRLQGFPDSFVDKCREIAISDTQLYKQAGNSMTADVMAYLIKEVLINEKSV
jgi:DNA (cytosine-5)-methyltransferase 1